jgi:TIR domain
MAYVPGCSADVFVSYARSDNQDRWVKKVRDRLASTLESSLSTVEVWFDEREIDPGEEFKRTIQERLKNIPVFVAIVSPTYIRSDFCMHEELDYFLDHGGREVIQLVKVPLERGDTGLPCPTKEAVLLFDKDRRELTTKKFGDALFKVATSIIRELREQRNKRDKIFIGQITDDAFKGAWDELKKALHEQEFSILPNEVLTERRSDSYVQAFLEDACLSIHLSGLRNDRLAKRQLDIAARLDKPLILLDSPPHGNRVAAVVEEIRAKLKSHRPRPSVYFIYDHHSDGQRVSSWQERLCAQTGWEVWKFETSDSHHRRRLQSCDGILLFRCEAPDQWLRAQEQALVQCIAVRPDPDVPVARYFTQRANGKPPEVRVQEEQPGQWRIERTGDADVGDLQPFFNALRSRGDAAAGGAI